MKYKQFITTQNKIKNELNEGAKQVTEKIQMLSLKCDVFAQCSKEQKEAICALKN
jgi:hypothetical protein